MLPMKCPRCCSSAIRATATNNRDADKTVRQRSCADCGHTWFTVEVVVSPAVVGWTAKAEGLASKPVLRLPVDLTIGRDAI